MANQSLCDGQWLHWGCGMAVPLEDTYSSTEVPIPELGASIRYTFVLSCNDAFKFRIMDDKRRKAFDSFRAMPNLPQAQRLNLGKTSSFPIARWCSRYPSDQPDCLNRRCPRRGYCGYVSSRLYSQTVILEFSALQTLSLSSSSSAWRLGDEPASPPDNHGDGPSPLRQKNHADE